jgi:hypothetical protein
MTKDMAAHSKNNGTLLTTTAKVADILEREIDFVIHDWMETVEKQEDLMHIFLNVDERTGHLPQLLREVIVRLRLDVSTKPLSQPRRVITGTCATNKVIRCPCRLRSHGFYRYASLPPLHKSASQLNFTKLLPDVVTIADEVDAQLKQQMVCYMPANAV